MADIVRDRLYYRRLGNDGEGWQLCLSSPESGFFQSIGFDPPSESELKAMSRETLGEMLIFQMAVGAAFGFRHGLVAASLKNVADIDPEAAWFRDEALKATPERRAESHAKRRAEEDAPGSQWPTATIVDWTRSSFSFKKK